ncbi:Protein FIZZY-RELATED 1 [Acorus gramineus]|uniref:Protein FIZZY-RELATED 1 n=1 Tax=Acorus gramineus TaxID=55184 RepID=A0AAV9BD28_ACOGR|nr:Protein FIZZY-RELATED 1 [Acorus gramineus]
MLVFRGSPKTNIRMVDKMLREDQNRNGVVKEFRSLPKGSERVLYAPNLLKDFYLNLIDWGPDNILATALGNTVYLYDAGKNEVQILTEVDHEDDYPTSVAWSCDGLTLAIGFNNSMIEIWDPKTSRLVRSIEAHSSRVGSLSWKHQILTSGSHDTSIINHDVRAYRAAYVLKGHSGEVCGLKWSESKGLLASGGNDNLVHVWEENMVSSKWLHRFDEHRAAVKALAWCPFECNTLASGGGTADRCIKIWNAQTGQCNVSIDSEAQSLFMFLQVCGLEWNRHRKEILSGHGYGRNNLCLRKYPSMSKIGELTGHLDRILNLSQSPDGSKVVSLGADETLRIWKVFEPPCRASCGMEEESLGRLSFETMHIR